MSSLLIAKQETLLQFDQFSNETGIEIGIKLLELAKSEGKSIAVDISKGRQQIFHAALEGMTPDHAEWLRRKTNTVYRFHSSTLKLHLHLKEHNKTLTEIFQLDPYDYVDSGGGFPIHVKGVGCIGAIAVTGTSQEHEHNLIVTCLSSYLGITDCPSLQYE